jgi:poly [ADP-ribose] polymerase
MYLFDMSQYMFGKGVYFADCVSKSANYCFASQHDYSSVGCMLLCEVALGNPRELLQSDYNADRLPANAHSTKGVGRTQPDPSGAVVLPDGVKVPCGKVQDVQVPGSALQYNEYIGAS